MRISSIYLMNFKSFKNQEFVFPPIRDNKNLIIIGGYNGYGKTTILEALCLGLYGPDGINCIARAEYGRVATSYARFLASSFNQSADSNEPMTVKIEFVDDQNNGFSIKRNWYFKKDRSWDTEDAQVFRVEDGIDREPFSIDMWNEILDEHFITANKAPFFFFDGEEVKMLAAKNNQSKIKDAIESFLGVHILNQLYQRLEDYELKKKRDATYVDMSRLEKLEQQRNQLSETLCGLENEKSDAEKILGDLENELEDLKNKFVSLGSSDGSIKSISEIITTIRDKENERTKLTQELNKLLSDKLSINLIDQNTVDEFIKQIQKEICTRKWRQECESLEPQKQKFISRFLEIDNYNPSLTDGQKQQLNEAICEAWESLYFPTPSDCTDICFHNYLDDKSINAIPGLLEKCKIGSEEISTKISDLNVLERQLEVWRLKRLKIEGLDKDSEYINDLKNQMSILSNKLTNCSKDIGSLTNQINSISYDLNIVNAEYNREKSLMMSSGPTNQLIEESRRIRDFIKDLIKELREIKIKQIQNEMTRVFKELSHKTNVDKITLDDTYTAQFWSNDGHKIDLDKSAGELQIFATTILVALANASSVTAPLVVDTPLGRLDGKHRESLLKYWTSDSTRQVILLSHDKEVSISQFSNLKDKILKSYVLNHENLSRGIGFSTAREGYFGV